MPGIHPASRKQVRLFFAMEARGQLPKGKARELAHDWKCWTKVPEPPGCKGAMKILNDARRQHPTWKVPAEVLAAEELRKKVKPFPERPARPAVAARVAGIGIVRRPLVAAYTAKPKPMTEKQVVASFKRQKKDEVLAGPLARIYAVAREAARGHKRARRVA
jgi:hypothetical protein